MKRFLFFICIPFLVSSCLTCAMIKEKVIGKTFNIQMDSLFIAEHHVFQVYGKNGLNRKDTTINISPIWHIDAFCRKGDILIKDSGRIDIKLVRKDTTLIIPFECKDFL